MDQDTILWYCSDNGGLLKESSGGRAKKGSIYEGGLRIPSILKWPGKDIHGRCAVPTSTVDIYPTVMSLIGGKVGSRNPLDGQDLVPIIKGKVKTRSKPLGFWHLFQKGQATHSDKILKDILAKQKSGKPTPHNEHRIKKDVDEFPQYSDDSSQGHAAWLDWPLKLHRIQGNRFELYNLEMDPMEKVNLISDQKFRKEKDRMKQKLKSWMKSVIRSLNGKDYQ